MWYWLNLFFVEIDLVLKFDIDEGYCIFEVYVMEVVIMDVSKIEVYVEVWIFVLVFVLILKVKDVVLVVLFE